MLIITPEKSFLKRCKQYVRPKDFLIADATADSGSEVSELGNRERTDEFSPTPTLMKIALDPDTSESRIKAKNINRYIDSWLDDPGINRRLNYFMSSIIKNWKEHGEDMNIFIVLQKAAYRNYAEVLRKYIGSIYGDETVFLLTRKMDRDDEDDILEKKYSRNDFERLEKITKKIGKGLAETTHKGDIYNFGDDDD